MTKPRILNWSPWQQSSDIKQTRAERKDRKRIPGRQLDSEGILCRARTIWRRRLAGRAIAAPVTSSRHSRWPFQTSIGSAGDDRCAAVLTWGERRFFYLFRISGPGVSEKTKNKTTVGSGFPNFRISHTLSLPAGSRSQQVSDDPCSSAALPTLRPR
jgi:hypothetical protein